MLGLTKDNIIDNQLKTDLNLKTTVCNFDTYSKRIILTDSFKINMEV